MKALNEMGKAAVPAGSSVFFASWCTALRFTLAAGFLALGLGRRLLGLTWLEVQQGLGIGLLGGVALVLQMDGMAYTLASTSAFLTQGYVVWIPIWVGLAHRRMPGWSVPVACVLSVIGAAMLGWQGGMDGGIRFARGEWETLAGSVMFSGQILWLERPKFRGNHSLRVTTVMFSVMMVTTLPLAVWTSPGPGWRPLLEAYQSPAAIGLLLALVGFCTLLTFPLANHWQPKVPATQAGLLYCTEPMFTSVVALWLPGLISRWTGIGYQNEVLTWNLLAGGAMILLANVGLQLRAAPPSEEMSLPSVG